MKTTIAKIIVVSAIACVVVYQQITIQSINKKLTPSAGAVDNQALKAFPEEKPVLRPASYVYRDLSFVYVDIIPSENIITFYPFITATKARGAIISIDISDNPDEKTIQARLRIEGDKLLDGFTDGKTRVKGYLEQQQREDQENQVVKQRKIEKKEYYDNIQSKLLK